MRTSIFAVLALATTVIASNAAPVKLTRDQMRSITAGNPNIGPNGTNVNSNGASGAPGNSFGAPGQTNNPNPGK
jgi:hypothetical protein